MYSTLLLAADSPATAPGWGKLGALILAFAGWFIVSRVMRRIKDAKDGKIADPFSPDAPADPEKADPQAKAPAEPSVEDLKREVEKTFRKGWRPPSWLRK